MHDLLLIFLELICGVPDLQGTARYTIVDAGFFVTLLAEEVLLTRLIHYQLGSYHKLVNSCVLILSMLSFFIN
jgi:hypothetical protein